MRHQKKIKGSESEYASVYPHAWHISCHSAGRLSLIVVGSPLCPQVSTGFMSFELLLDILNLSRDTWEVQPPPYKSLVGYVQKMEFHIGKLMPIAWEHMPATQTKQRQANNRRTQKSNPETMSCYCSPTAPASFLITGMVPTWWLRNCSKRAPTQINYINLLKLWIKLVPAFTAALVPTRRSVGQVTLSQDLSPSQQQDL